MNGINLLKYHDKSFSDIHRLTHGEMEDELFTQLVLSPSQEKKKKSVKLSPVYLAALTLTLTAAMVAYFYFQTGRNPADLLHPVIDKAADATRSVIPKTRLEREGYTKIGEIIFINGDAPEENATLVSEYKPEDAPPEEEIPLVAVKPLDNKEEPPPRKQYIARGTYVAVGKDPDRKEAPPVRRSAPAASQPVNSAVPMPKPVPEKKYSVVIGGVKNDRLANITANAEKAGMKADAVKISSNVTNVWRVYKLVPGAKMKVAGRGVEFVRDFSNQEDAVGFVRKNGFPGAIKQVKLENSVYNITVCCAGAEKARRFAAQNNPAGTTIKVVEAVKE
jgi:hypothetical protein